MYEAEEFLIVRKTEWTISLFQGLLVNVLFIPLFVFQTFDLFVAYVFSFRELVTWLFKQPLK